MPPASGCRTDPPIGAAKVLIASPPIAKGAPLSSIIARRDGDRPYRTFPEPAKEESSGREASSRRAMTSDSRRSRFRRTQASSPLQQFSLPPGLGRKLGVFLWVLILQAPEPHPRPGGAGALSQQPPSPRFVALQHVLSKVSLVMFTMLAIGAPFPCVWRWWLAVAAFRNRAVCTAPFRQQW